MNRSLVLISVAALLTSAASAMPPGRHSPQPPEPAVTFESMRKVFLEIQERVALARRRGNRLTELDALRALEVEHSARGPAAKIALANWFLTIAPELGRYQEALRHADIIQRHQPQEEPRGRDTRGYHPREAVQAIADAAGARRVIMINEAHHVPQHRAFTIELLKALRTRGFTHFAAETLYEADHRLAERGYPTRETGYYTSEPVHGDLIRVALELGYQVIPYEPPVIRDADQRERDQAKNLFERAIKDQAGARLLVHAGFSHIDESGMRTGAVTMAQRFKELSGIDPFTIDQTVMSERSEAELEHPLYREVVAERLARATLLRSPGGKLWSLDPATHDATLFHPRSRYVGGRPTWLSLDGRRRSYPMPKKICESAARCLVRSRLASESADAIPVDQLEVVSNEPAPMLMLPEGEFVVEVEDAEGKRLAARRLRAGRHGLRSTPGY